MSYLPITADRIESMRKNLDAALKALDDSGIEFSGIVIRGLSGALAAHYVCDKTGKPILVIRKGEHSHGNEVETPYPNKIEKYIILDDLIASGNTIVSIKNKMDEWRFDNNFQLVAIVLYSSCPIEENPNVRAWEEAGLKGTPIFSHYGRQYRRELSPAPETETVSV